MLLQRFSTMKLFKVYLHVCSTSSVKNTIYFSLYQVVSAIGNMKYTDMIRLLEHRKWSPLFESLVQTFKNLRPTL